MEISRKCCRLCLSESDFSVPLFGNYCLKTNMIEKILICLRIPIEQSECLNTICHQCACNVERYYDFINDIKKAQTKLGSKSSVKREDFKNVHLNKRLVTSYVREQVIDADYTFSFLESSNAEEKKENKPSSPFFSYFSPPNAVKKDTLWKTPNQKRRENSGPGNSTYKTKVERPKNHSRDLFESQSQDVGEDRQTDWKLTPNNNIMRRVREKCFALSDF